MKYGVTVVASFQSEECRINKGKINEERTSVVCRKEELKEVRR